jgi:hypothetical protein
MRRFLYNWVARPLAYVIPVIIAANMLGLDPNWRLWLFMWIADMLWVATNVLFPEWKATPKGNENAKR